MLETVMGRVLGGDRGLGGGGGMWRTRRNEVGMYETGGKCRV